MEPRKLSPLPQVPVDPAVTSHAPVNLISFEETFNFKQFVRDHLAHSQTDIVAEEIIKSARVVGQERDGSILFSWDVPLGPSSEKTVTKVGLYSLNSPSYRVLYTNPEAIHICGASVNCDRTLLTFSTQELLGADINYETYIAEIQPHSRMLSLNLGSCDFRKVQFIYPASGSEPSRRLSRPFALHAPLLVIIPGHWICLYCFKLEVVEKGVTITSQPKSRIITENAPWYQWDPTNQWLYYARFESASMPSVSSVPGSRVNQNTLVLCVLAFDDSTEHTLLTISLSLPYNTSYYLGSATYYNDPLSFSPPVDELNMKVLYTDEGLWCVCLQHNKDLALSPQLPRKREPEKNPKQTQLHYSIYLIHNGHVMDAHVTSPIPPTQRQHINFLLCHSCIIAYIPGVLFHLLNVGPKSDPCHHLMFGQEHAPLLPFSKSSLVVPGRTAAPILVSAVSSDSTYAVMGIESQVFYSCCLNPNGCLELFKMSSSKPDIQESLLHLMLVMFRLYAEAVRMLEHICQTPVSLSDPRLFAEFLVAFSYASVESDYRPYLVRRLPLTNSMTYRDCIYKNRDGTTSVILRCTEIPNFINQLLVQSDHKLVAISEDDRLAFDPSKNDRFEQLCYQAYLNQPSVYKRISLNSIRTLALSPALQPSQGTASAGTTKRKPKRRENVMRTSPENLMRSGSLMVRLKQLINSPKTSRAAENEDHDDAMQFLVPDKELELEQSQKEAIIQDLIKKALSRGLKMSCKATNTNVCITSDGYWEEIQRASLILLKVIWESLGFTMETHPLNRSIHRVASSTEVVFFELLESYHMAHTDLGLPLPSGFQTMFISMGYLCLAPVVFLQYLKNGVFTPTPRFLHFLFTEYDEVDDRLLFEIVSLLDENMLEVAMGLWKSPLLGLFAVRQSYVN